MQHSSITQFRLNKESYRYNDIIQQNFIDTYHNLTIKSVLALKWITKNCWNKVAFIIKCDDDTFLHMPNLLHYLLGGTIPMYLDTLQLYTYWQLNPLANRLNKTKNILVGHMVCSDLPERNKVMKWYLWFINIYLKIIILFSGICPNLCILLVRCPII